MQRKTAIILGDSFNNTLGLIRSLGEAGTKVILILVGNDRLFVSRSKYVSKVYKIHTLDVIEELLKRIANEYSGSYLICSNDKAAKWVDDNEKWLSKLYLTPMRGNRLGHLFEKPEQCELAEKFGIKVPKSVIYNRCSQFPVDIEYPILLKPADSNSGEKSDIHICRTSEEVKKALEQDSKCDTYIVQEYIKKEYEINMIGIGTENGVIIPGGIRKIRHYPTIYSACSYGLFTPAADLNVNVEPIKRMIEAIGYHGPFSVEFLHKNGKDYFMEVNFRHDGLAYTATASGVNLLKMYIEGRPIQYSIKPTYMMDISTDYCHVKDGNMTRTEWAKDFMKTQCQLNFNWRDPIPTMRYYLNKFTKK